MAHLPHPPQPSVQRAARRLLRNAEPLTAHQHFAALREAIGMSQGDIATIVGVSGPNVNDWEKGKGKPNAANQRGIEGWSRYVAKALGLPDSAVLPATKWLSEEERRRVESLQEPVVGTVAS